MTTGRIRRIHLISPSLPAREKCKTQTTKTAFPRRSQEIEPEKKTSSVLQLHVSHRVLLVLNDKTDVTPSAVAGSSALFLRLLCFTYSASSRLLRYALLLVHVLSIDRQTGVGATPLLMQEKVCRAAGEGEINP